MFLSDVLLVWQSHRFLETDDFCSSVAVIILRTSADSPYFSLSIGESPNSLGPTAQEIYRFSRGLGLEKPGPR